MLHNQIVQVILRKMTGVVMGIQKTRIVLRGHGDFPRKRPIGHLLPFKTDWSVRSYAISAHRNRYGLAVVEKGGGDSVSGRRLMTGPDIGHGKGLVIVV